ncbi:hypothetical protein BDV12DRAFT_188271 [Aspergillus spectabilis]
MSSASESPSSSSGSSDSARSSPFSDHSFSPELPYRTTTTPVADTQKTFLFIDSQADIPENQALKKTKQTFLLKNYNRRKRQAAIDRLKLSKPSPSTRLRIEHPSASDPSNPEHSTSTGGEDHVYQHASESIESIAQNAATMSEMWSIRADVSQGYTDPFSSYGVDLTNSINLYLHHFRSRTMPACYPLDSTRMSMWWWQKATTQPALLRAFLFLAAGHQATLESASGISSRVVQKSMRDCLYLRGDTLKTLNNIMQDPVRAVAESTALAVASLVTIEAVNANFTALDAHFKGLKRLIHLTGGLEPLDHMYLSKLYQCDVKNAALHNSQPIFPIVPRWRTEILQHSRVFEITGHKELKTPKALITLGLSIFNAPWYTHLDLTMQSLLRIFSRVIIYYETVILSPALVMPADNDLFILFEHQLLSTAYPADDTTTANTIPTQNPKQKYHPLNEPLRLALLVYLNVRIWHLQPFAFMQHITESLKQSLLTHTCIPKLQSTSPELLFWILFIGGLASQGYTTHYWFVNHLIEVTRYLAVEGLDEARWVLGGFFYTEQPEERKAEEALWNEVLAREAYRSIAPKPQLVGDQYREISPTKL